MKWLILFVCAMSFGCQKTIHEAHLSGHAAAAHALSVHNRAIG